METNEALVNRAHVKLLNAIAGQTGIRIVYDQNVATPYATADRVVHMPPPAAVEAWWYWVGAYHELGHLMPEMSWTYQDLQSTIDMKDPIVAAVANIVVDNLNERNFYGTYAGVDKMLDRGRAWIISDWFTPENTKEKGNPVLTLVQGLILEDAAHRQNWMGSNVESIYLGTWRPERAKVLEGLKSIKYQERIEKLSSMDRPTKETKELIYDILSLINHKPQEPQNQGQGAQGEAGECPECNGSGAQAGPNGTEPCEACDGTGEKQSVSGDSQSEGNKLQSGEAAEFETDGIGKGHAAADKALDHVRTKATPADIAAIEAALKSKLEGILKEPKKADRQGPYSRKGGAKEYIPWTRKKTIELSETDRPNGHYDHAIRTALGSSSVSKQVAKFLKVMATDTYTYGQRRGKLHQKNIHKACGSQVPGVQPGIFKQKLSSTLKTDSVVTILQDCSGSMSGSRYSIASACVVALNETLTDLRIPHEILGFTEMHKLQHYVFKRFGKSVSKEQMIRIMASENVEMGSNADGESVHWAAQRLMERREKRKLLIVLSDGRPAGYFEGDGNKYLKHICEIIEEESPIDLVGIGISTDATEQFYKHHAVVDNPNQLDTVLFGILKDFLV